jgi:hypothetical protein
LKNQNLKYNEEKDMFLEIYIIPLSDYSKGADISIRPENKRLIEMTGARIRHSIELEDRAEIVLPSKEILTAVGSYENLVQRLIDADSKLIARA